MDTITIYLDLADEKFYEWLLKFCNKKQHEGKEFTTPEGQKYHFNFPLLEPLPKLFLPDWDQLAIGAVFSNGKKVVGSENAMIISWERPNILLNVTIANYEAQWAFYPVLDLLNDVKANWSDTHKVIGDYIQEKTKKYNIPLAIGAFDKLCIEWVREADYRTMNKKNFLVTKGVYLSTKTFDRELQSAHERGLIDKDPKTGRYFPKRSP